MNKAFWMVFRNDASNYSSAPTKRHETFKSAKKEAERLMVKHNASFLVLKAIEEVYPETIIATRKFK